MGLPRSVGDDEVVDELIEDIDMSVADLLAAEHVLTRASALLCAALSEQDETHLELHDHHHHHDQDTVQNDGVPLYSSQNQQLECELLPDASGIHWLTLQVMIQAGATEIAGTDVREMLAQMGALQADMIVDDSDHSQKNHMQVAMETGVRWNFTGGPLGLVNRELRARPFATQLVASPALRSVNRVSSREMLLAMDELVASSARLQKHNNNDSMQRLGVSLAVQEEIDAVEALTLVALEECKHLVITGVTAPPCSSPLAGEHTFKTYERVAAAVPAPHELQLELPLNVEQIDALSLRNSHGRALFGRVPRNQLVVRFPVSPVLNHLCEIGPVVFGDYGSDDLTVSEDSD